MSQYSLVPLRDLILESQNGLSKRSGTDGVNTPVLRLADITAGKIDQSDPREIRLTAKELAKYALQHEDLVCIRVNGSKALVGRVIQFRANRAWAYCDHFIRLRPNQAIVDYRYLAHYFNSQTVRRHIELNMVSSAGQNTVSQGTMLDISVPCPGLETQREVVAELEKQFSRLDEAVANLQRVKANLKRYKASVLKAAVEGRLVETEASLAHREGRTFETGEQLLERTLAERRTKWVGRGKFKAATQSTEVQGFVVPAGWVIASSEQVCASVRDGTHNTPDYVSDGVPLVTSKNLEEYGIDFENVKFISESDHDEISKRSGVGVGDVLFAMIGTVGNPCEVQTSKRFSIKNVGLFKANQEFLNSTYFCYWLLSSPLNKWLDPRLKGTTQKFAPLGLLRELPVLLPPLAEQIRIVAEVDRHLSIVREVEAEVDTNLKRAQALRQATLSKAFSS
ncbi:restriction endonuclease subunit S [Polaromonas sp.]|uniref:restriction endonuclease subunit S n=1 Tax=Polaromonas sp. TaxID=1869339 RepID=UPI0024881541|nr:restriction endonuclease subunit S [Polaromonas sp.]MDI1275434.1 restriction endonuclease subunit S [Polaromonas sp.]